jgi:hypothetical protein
VTLLCEHALFLNECFFDFMFHFVCDGWQNQASSATETLEMLRETFGEHSLSRTAVFEWHSRFKAGQVSVKDDERSGRPSTTKTTENVEKIR